MNQKIDKSTWGDGPWQTEPDELRWRDEETSLPCAILRNPDAGNLCGYVGIPPGHVLFGWEHKDKIHLRPEFLDGYFDRDFGIVDVVLYAFSDDEKYDVIPLGMALHVHGGVTWSGCLPREPGDGHHYFGFDCGHAGDYTPGLMHLLPSPPSWMTQEEYCTIAFVKRECERLAWQLRRLEAERSLVGE